VDIATIKDALEATVIEGENGLNAQIDHVYASDLMSDVLAFGKPNSILLTGLATQQAVISAHMAEFKGVVFIRGKHPKDGSGKFARDNELVLLSTRLDMYDACVRIDRRTKGGQPASGAELAHRETEELLLSNEFFIEGSDFASAGMVSTEVKSVLKKIGFEPKLVRRVAISTYEGEMNVVMHARRAKVNLSVTPRLVEVVIDDEGQGIPLDKQSRLFEPFYRVDSGLGRRTQGVGLGLFLVKAIVEGHGGHVWVQSAPGKGSTFYFTLPLR